jgi:hypothetical protein
MGKFLVYAFCRDDGTFYYIGKGTGRRPFVKRKTGIKPPQNKDRIIILHSNLDEATAFEYEKGLISFYGRKDQGTGLLRNSTDGGEGVAGWNPGPEWREKKSQSMKGENNPFYGQQHTSNIMKEIIEKAKETKLAKKITELGLEDKDEKVVEKAITLDAKIAAHKRKRGLMPHVGMTGEANPMYGCKRPDLADRNKKQPFRQGLKWINNGEVEMRVTVGETPDGFWPGRLPAGFHRKSIELTNMETGESKVFPSAKEAARALQVSEKGLRRVANGKQKSCGGFVAIFLVLL